MGKIKIYLISLVLLFVSFGCSKKTDFNNVSIFMNNYIQTVSHEHALYKQNITEKITAYFFDEKNKNKAQYPEFLELGAFTDKILIVDNYSLEKIEINTILEDFNNAFTVTVLYKINGEITNDKKTVYNAPIEKKVNYWIISYKGNLYIYSDTFLKDIFILEKDLSLVQ